MDNINIKLVTDDMTAMIEALTNMVKTIENYKSNLISLDDVGKSSLIRSINSDFRRALGYHHFNIFRKENGKIQVAKEYRYYKHYSILEQYAKIINGLECVIEYYGIYEMLDIFNDISWRSDIRERDWDRFKRLIKCPISRKDGSTEDCYKELKVIYNNGGI